MFLFFLVVKEETEVVDGEVKIYPITLACRDLEVVAGWTLAGENPTFYNQLHLWHGARREWPQQPLPGSSQAPVPTGSAAMPSTSEDVRGASQEGHSHSKEVLEELYRVHHVVAKMIMGLGGDPFKHFQDTNLENILEKIKSTDLSCKVCGKQYSTSARMKNHFRKRHLGKTKYQCDICKRYYTDAGSLREHARVHDATLNPHKCPVCPKTFGTEAKLRQHQPVHGKPQFACQFEGCDKEFKWPKGKKEHEAKCPHNPNLPKEPPFKCSKCDKAYWDKRSLDRHLRDKKH